MLWSMARCGVGASLGRTQSRSMEVVSDNLAAQGNREVDENPDRTPRPGQGPGSCSEGDNALAW
jgi:hypothetical protein